MRFWIKMPRIWLICFPFIFHLIIWLYNFVKWQKRQRRTKTVKKENQIKANNVITNTNNNNTTPTTTKAPNKTTTKSFNNLNMPSVSGRTKCTASKSLCVCVCVVWMRIFVVRKHAFLFTCAFDFQIAIHKLSHPVKIQVLTHFSNNRNHHIALFQFMCTH